jgi:hypothetical protein
MKRAIIALAIIFSVIGPLGQASPAVAGSTGCWVGAWNPWVSGNSIAAKGHGQCSSSAGETLWVELYIGNSRATYATTSSYGYKVLTVTCVKRTAGPYQYRTHVMLKQNGTFVLLAETWSPTVYLTGGC